MLLAVNGHMADLKKEEGGRQDVLEVLPMQLLFGESRGDGRMGVVVEVHPMQLLFGESKGGGRMGGSLGSMELLIGESSQVVPYRGGGGGKELGGEGKGWMKGGAHTSCLALGSA